ncbi:MAG TPA: hypothetical protein PLC42_01545 [Parachlamydiaceae bacterium]|nr:hypothetical protein [Parachlamydiaceae bacterium]
MSFALPLLNNFVSKLNQPNIKQNVKNIAGMITFTGGILSVATIFSKTLDKEVKQEKEKSRIFKSFNVMETTILKASLFFSAVASPIGNALVGKIANAVFGTERLVSYFGPNTIFALNPTHPRHLISFVAAASILPNLEVVLHKSISTSDYTLLYPVFRKIAFFNFITSRPILHIGNSLAGRIFKS